MIAMLLGGDGKDSHHFSHVNGDPTEPPTTEALNKALLMCSMFLGGSRAAVGAYPWSNQKSPGDGNYG